MKVLFAVSNENISTQIVKRYQKEYKEIISYKNMYYFNAIVKELQRDKSYDRIVISEDLEPFANNNLDAIEKFIFEKLDNISDEATGINGKEIPIILLATDKRRKSDSILVKLFGIGIYNILLGQDRTTDNVCSLLNKPRNKKEAKTYYKIETEEVNYRSESETNVSETEIKNILNHYRKLGKDEDRYVESFNNIAAQYNDAQLRIITKFLPLNVKAVLEEQSQKYQSVMTFDVASTSELMRKKDEEEGLKVGFLNYSNANKLTRPVIVPTAVKKVATKKSVEIPKVAEDINEIKNEIETDSLPGFDNVIEDDNDFLSEFEDVVDNSVENKEPEIIEPVKKGRGRPRKIVSETELQKANVVKRGRGRPRKIVEEIQEIDEDILTGFEDIKQTNLDENGTTLSDFEDIEKDISLPGFKNIEENQTLTGLDDLEENDILPGFDKIDNENDDTLPGFDEVENVDVLPGFDDIEETESGDTLPGFNDVEEAEDNTLPGFNDVEEAEDNTLPGFDETETVPKDFSSNGNTPELLLRDKKVVSFVGTTKNGTSFLVNNIAKTLASMGIKTAILDLTKNKNSYYIFTKNEENLRKIAYTSFEKLNNGIAEGINVNKSLSVYTSLPGEQQDIQDVNTIISTLVNNHNIILIDCDFDTPYAYFEVAQEIYLIQSMDILTIQPLTYLLKELKNMNIDLDNINYIVLYIRLNKVR